MSRMRQSRQSAISVTDKGKYPRCQRRKEHQKEALNLVCLSAQCKFRGLICIQCKTSEHSGHNVIPLKTFLSRIEDSLKKVELERKPRMQQSSAIHAVNSRSLLQKLEEQHLEMLSLLMLQVEQVAEKVRRCEQEVIREFDSLKERICTQFEKETIIEKSLVEIQRLFSEVQKDETIDLRLNIAKLISLVKIDKNDCSVLNQAEKELNAYILTSKTFKNNILVWERQTSCILSEIFKTKPEYQLKDTNNRPTTADPASRTSSSLTFSPTLKTDSILLDKEKMIAKVKDDKAGKVVLLSHSVPEHKNYPLRFKITTISVGSIVMIGLCNKAHLTQKTFKFDKNNANHGLYVAASNGFVYSSGDSQINGTKNHLSFKTGDELGLEVDAKESRLVVKKKSDSKSVEISLKHIQQADWKQLFFCVSFGSTGDKVQLLG